MEKDLKKTKSEYFKERYKNNKEMYKNNAKNYWCNYAKNILGKQFVSEEEIKQVKNAYYRKYRKENKEIIDKNLADFWDRKSQKLEAIQESLSSSQQNRLTFFDVIGQTPNNENLTSNYLAFLLNPNTNGVGNKVMQALLKAIHRDDILIDQEDFLYIQREATTNDRRRIDLLIKYSKHWIVIENKMDAIENENQTEVYYNSIHKLQEDANTIYIYLKPPYNSSTPLSDIFTCLEYDTFIHELEKISIKDYISNEEYKYRFLEDFIIALKKYITINKTTSTLADEDYLSRNEQLISKICKTIEKNFSQFKIVPLLHWGCIQIYKSNWKNTKHKGGIHYEIWSKSGLKVLGKTSDEICICLHAESNLSPAVLLELKEHQVEKTRNSKVIIEQFKVLSFDTEEHITIATDEIIKALKEYDSKYTKAIDEVMAKF